MKINQDKDQMLGMLVASGAYLLWGLLPIYWKLLEDIAPAEILAHRIVWSFVFMLVILGLSSKLSSFFHDCSVILKERKKLLAIVFASGLISVNWFVYIWAVNNDHIIETSLGYYINPLVSVLLGVLILKEKLSFWQMTAVLIAAIGVLHMTLQFSSIPWVALTLASSFAFYGLFKKIANVGALTGLTFETLLITPFAMLFLGMLMANGTSSVSFTWSSSLLLIGAGVATAVPLLLFAAGAKRITLSLIGFFQYIAPTIHLLIGVFLYHEPFTSSHATGFLFIWSALILFTLAKTKLFVRIEPKFRTKAKPIEKGRTLS